MPRLRRRNNAAIIRGAVLPKYLERRQTKYATKAAGNATSRNGPLWPISASILTCVAGARNACMVIPKNLAWRMPCQKTRGRNRYEASRSTNATPHAAAQIVTAARRRGGARYSMKASAIGSRIIKENWDPIAKASESPSSKVRRQFHTTTSRGAYKVWATAMAVKMAPNVPHAAPISGCAKYRVLLRSITGEKQYEANAM